MNVVRGIMSECKGEGGWNGMERAINAEKAIARDGKRARRECWAGESKRRSMGPTVKGAAVVFIGCRMEVVRLMRICSGAQALAITACERECGDTGMRSCRVVSVRPAHAASRLVRCIALWLLPEMGCINTLLRSSKAR